uniref:Transmembrane protein n=1 Tax=Cucumis melo TaxID=3656 RepID=A0A9I9DNF8_CUCME
MSEVEEEEKLSPSSIFLSQISQFCSLIISHPLYFSYFLFFSPYILKVLSFLSPLSTVTFLLLLLPFLFTFFSHSHQNQDHDQLFLLDEWYNNFFNTIQFPLLEEAQEPEIKKEINQEETKDHHHHYDIIEDGISTRNSSKEEKVGTNCSIIKSVMECKVFEDEEKMDLLWEKYEDQELVVVIEEEVNKKNRCISKKKDLRSLVNQQKEMEELEEEEEEEENGKICCLQALKFSSSKMRFGMGKKNGLKKISKAFKGLKFLHQLTTNGKNKTHS